MKKGISGTMITKIDLEKAYDHINWDFLQHVLKDVGFGHEMIHFVMHCTSDVSLSIYGTERFWRGFILQEASVKETRCPRIYLFYAWMYLANTFPSQWSKEIGEVLEFLGRPQF